MLTFEAMGWPVFVLGVIGGCVALFDDWRRASLLVCFPVVFLAFLANTYPVSRYTNIMLPVVAVMAAYAIAKASESAGRLLARGGWGLPRIRVQTITAVTLTGVAAVPALSASIQWNRFFGQDDTRTLARRFIEGTIPSGSTILLQPHGVQLPVTRDSLVEALRANLGDERRASTKFQLRLSAPVTRGPAYRVLWLGRGQDADLIYVPYETLTRPGALRRLGVDCVILKTHRSLSPEAVPLARLLERDATLVGVMSPYRQGVEPADPGVPSPFLHNTDARLSTSLERPGPVLSIYRLKD
jgi:hypothetical protein